MEQLIFSARNFISPSNGILYSLLLHVLIMAILQFFFTGPVSLYSKNEPTYLKLNLTSISSGIGKSKKRIPNIGSNLIHSSPKTITEGPATIGSNNSNSPSAEGIAVKTQDGNPMMGETVIRPTYPLFSRLKKEQGKVAINVTVDQEGKIAQIGPIGESPSEYLTKAAIEAIQKAQFSNDMAPGVYKLIFNFILD